MHLVSASVSAKLDVPRGVKRVAFDFAFGPGGTGNRIYLTNDALSEVLVFEETGTEVGRLLAEDGVDVALLVPI